MYVGLTRQEYYGIGAKQVIFFSEQQKMLPRKLHKSIYSLLPSWSTKLSKL